MLKILPAEQIRQADEYTIFNEPVSSIDLMERAASNFYRLIADKCSENIPFIFCGPGNNGGDGLVIARKIYEGGADAFVYILASEKYSENFKINLRRLEELEEVPIQYLTSEKDFPVLQSNENPIDHPALPPMIIDALFGSGLNAALGGLAAKLVVFLNRQTAIRIAVDIPSGLFADKCPAGVSFHADETVTFQSPKLSFMFAESSESVGLFKVIDIGLNQSFIESLPSKNFLVRHYDISQRIKLRDKFDHKGKFGHAFIHAGGAGKMGAAILCAKACARAGAGLTTAHIPAGQSLSMNIAVPEVMTEEYPKGNLSLPDLEKYSAFAFGPGLGSNDSSREILLSLLQKVQAPVVLDADALNILAAEKNWWTLVPKNSILTPHLKEFERLAGQTSNWEERHRRQVELSTQHSLHIVLKGAYTCITTPDGHSYFNSTGNPGMAKGGSGDVLTGMIVSLLAQHYSPEEACITGVYLHGLAADHAVEYESEESLLASDIIDSIGDAFQEFHPSPDDLPFPNWGNEDFDVDDDVVDTDLMRNN